MQQNRISVYIYAENPISHIAINSQTIEFNHNALLNQKENSMFIWDEYVYMCEYE